MRVVHTCLGESRSRGLAWLALIPLAGLVWLGSSILGWILDSALLSWLAARPWVMPTMMLGSAAGIISVVIAIGDGRQTPIDQSRVVKVLRALPELPAPTAAAELEASTPSTITLSSGWTVNRPAPALSAPIYEES